MHRKHGCYYSQPEVYDDNANFVASNVKIVSTYLTYVFIQKEFREGLLYPKHYKNPHRKSKYDTKHQCLIADLSYIRCSHVNIIHSPELRYVL